MKSKSKNKHCNGTTFTKGHRKIDTTVSGDVLERECPVDTRVRRHILNIPRQIDKNQLRLRPRATECNLSDTSENIADIGRLSDLLNASQAQKCGSKMEASACSRKGLCTSAQHSAKKCGFVVDKAMTSDTKKQRGVPPGPPSRNLNQRLALAAAKTKAGPNDLAFILAALDIRPPSKETLRRHFDKVSDLIQDANQRSMEESQRLLREQTQNVDVETGINRPQRGMEAGTQSFAPIIDINTGVILNIETANKLCPIPNCSHEDGCKRSIRADVTISSTERSMALEILRSIERNNHLNVISVTSDASAQLMNTVRDHSRAVSRPITQYTCLIHKMRNLQKDMAAVKLSGNVQLSRGATRDIYVRQLVGCFRRRVYGEIVRIQRTQNLSRRGEESN